VFRKPNFVRSTLALPAILLCALLASCSKGSHTVGSHTVSSHTISGSVIRGERARHPVKARAGQTLDVSIASDENNAVFQIYSPGEKEMLPGAGEMDDATKWSGKLPAEGEYVIVVGPTRGNATYTLTYSIN
jgi:hypothetical protein